MTYVSRPMGNRLGIHASEIEELREQAALTSAGFRQEGTDALKNEKEAIQREMYRRADENLPSGIGSPGLGPDSESKRSKDEEGL